MKITNLRTGRIVRVALVVLLTIPIIYIILNYSDSHQKINKVYHEKFTGKRHISVPVLADGEKKSKLYV